jgi:hypothetical protein
MSGARRAWSGRSRTSRTTATRSSPGRHGYAEETLGLGGDLFECVGVSALDGLCLADQQSQRILAEALLGLDLARPAERGPAAVGASRPARVGVDAEIRSTGQAAQHGDLRVSRG